MKEQKAYIGKESLDSLHGELLAIKPHRIFLVHGKNSYVKCGAKDKISKILDNFVEADVLEYSDFSVNPEFNDLQKALLLCEDYNPDLIIALGGGSVLDTAKLIRFFHSYEGEIDKGIYTKKSSLVPLVALPTTSGTGAEATHFAVLYKDKTKYSVEHDDILPEIAIVYPPFTYNNPPYLTACTGFDALAQGIEAFWNKNATKESDGYAKKAIELIYPNLPLSVNSPSDEVRDKMSEGSYWAGRAINITKTTAPHAFSYPFTSYYRIPHGHAVAMVFPSVAQYNFINGIISQDKINYLYNTLGIIDKPFKRVADYVNNLNLFIPNIKYDLNILLDNINEKRLKNNPALISKEDSIKILSSALRQWFF